MSAEVPEAASAEEQKEMEDKVTSPEKAEEAKLKARVEARECVAIYEARITLSISEKTKGTKQRRYMNIESDRPVISSGISPDQESFGCPDSLNCLAGLPRKFLGLCTWLRGKRQNVPRTDQCKMGVTVQCLFKGAVGETVTHTVDRNGNDGSHKNVYTFSEAESFRGWRAEEHLTSSEDTALPASSQNTLEVVGIVTHSQVKMAGTKEKGRST
ncbi:hypothetical protein MG293_006653 [Ovis ammon polii]|uniref:Uncharacterized protein n=1 Tax=Ovis ammon polii TaxID=230172 RepID=A0AAD4UHH6_OVIAM|nr:hypothetical protein MG293_006653 [Ovis ammon polii]